VEEATANFGLPRQAREVDACHAGIPQTEERTGQLVTLEAAVAAAAVDSLEEQHNRWESHQDQKVEAAAHMPRTAESPEEHLQEWLILE
jgi:hypothetical protein